eukprot:1147146-Pelagomonas_calceolata.AAC.19
MALSSVERSCTMLVACERQASPTEIKEALEGNDAEAKVEAMKKAIMLLLSGEQMPQLFITIVRYVLPSEDHTVQKLLLLYLRCIDTCCCCRVSVPNQLRSNPCEQLPQMGLPTCLTKLGRDGLVCESMIGHWKAAMPHRVSVWIQLGEMLVAQTFAQQLPQTVQVPHEAYPVSTEPCMSM